MMVSEQVLNSAAVVIYGFLIFLAITATALSVVSKLFSLTSSKFDEKKKLFDTIHNFSFSWAVLNFILALLFFLSFRKKIEFSELKAINPLTVGFVFIFLHTLIFLIERLATMKKFQKREV